MLVAQGKQHATSWLRFDFLPRAPCFNGSRTMREHVSRCRPEKGVWGNATGRRKSDLDCESQAAAEGNGNGF